jgi:hypothetical protein
MVILGLAAILVFGGIAYFAAIWGFVMMDNPPPGQPYLLLWDVGRTGLLVGTVTLFAGVILGSLLLAAALIRRIRRRANP